MVVELCVMEWEGRPKRTSLRRSGEDSSGARHVSISRMGVAWLLLGLALLWARADRVPAQVGVKKPGPADIPQRLVSDIGLAGDPRPDIARFPNVRSVDSSSLSPDGQRLAFVTRTTGQPQLWVVDVAGGAPWQLTFRDESVTFQDWSPAGGWIAYGTDQNGNEREGYTSFRPMACRSAPSWLPPTLSGDGAAGLLMGGRSPSPPRNETRSTSTSMSWTSGRMALTARRGASTRGRERCTWPAGGRTEERSC